MTDEENNIAITKLFFDLARTDIGRPAVHIIVPDEISVHACITREWEDGLYNSLCGSWYTREPPTGNGRDATCKICLRAFVKINATGYLNWQAGVILGVLRRYRARQRHAADSRR